MSPAQPSAWPSEDGEEQPHSNEVEMGARLMPSNQWSSPPPTQHITNVLGDALSRRKGSGCHDCLADRPYPVCNWPTIGLLLVTLLLAAALAARELSSPRISHTGPDANLDTGAEGDAFTSPEGRVIGSVGIARDYRGQARSVQGTNGAVAADHGRCSDHGVEVLQSGGNAVDAAVATALCLGIHNPQASGIGGGTFMLIQSPNGSAEVIDARELASRAASTNMYAGKASNASLEGGLSIAAPLELKGIWLAHQRHGSRPWSELVLPAARKAGTGFPAHPYLINALRNSNATLLKYPEMRAAFYKADGDRWRPPRVNETCCERPVLAAFLEEVARDGPAAYDRHAEAMAAEIQSAGGILTMADLVDAQPVIKQPLRAQMWGLEVLAVPPPSSGACVVAALQFLAGYQPLLGLGNGLGMHRIVEALKHAFALRMRFGDPGSCPGAGCFLPNMTPLLADMLSSAFATSLRNASSDASTGAPGAYGGQWHVDASMPDDHGTSHLSIVDGQGGAVAMTSTVNTGWGSKLLSASTGILFNNQMDDFSLPGTPNIYGVEPSEANYIQPLRKPLSSMSPVIVRGPAGELRAVVGASGGPRIISSVLQVLLRMIVMGQEPLAAVSAPRLHHQLLPDTVRVEEWAAGELSLHVSNQTVQALRLRGHNVTDSTWSGVTQAVVLDTDLALLTAVSDPRKDGAPCAF